MERMETNSKNKCTHEKRVSADKDTAGYLASIKIESRNVKKEEEEAQL